MPPERLSRATSFAAVGQELAGSVGVTVAALGLELMQRVQGGGAIDPGHFPPVFLLIAFLSACSALVFARLPNDAGSALLVTNGKPEKEADKETAGAGQGHIG